MILTRKQLQDQILLFAHNANGEKETELNYLQRYIDMSDETMPGTSSGTVVMQ